MGRYIYGCSVYSGYVRVSTSRVVMVMGPEKRREMLVERAVVCIEFFDFFISFH